MSADKQWFMGLVADSSAPCQPERCITRRISFWILVGLVGAALAAWLPAAVSQERWITLNGLAAHLSSGDNCNSITTGAGLEIGSRDWRTVAGFYRNSNCRWTVYAGEAWLPLHLGMVSMGAVVGAATGYSAAVIPAGGLALAVDGRRFGANLTYIPPIHDGGNVLWLQVKARY